MLVRSLPDMKRYLSLLPSEQNRNALLKLLLLPGETENKQQPRCLSWATSTEARKGL